MRIFLKELDESIKAFDATKATFGTADLMYNGDVTKWKKFAYTLMLRLGMRLTEVDAATAKTWVEKAIAGGVIVDDADRAVIAYVDGSQVASRNFIAGRVDQHRLHYARRRHVEGGKFAKTFIDYLKNTKDPRLNVISIVWTTTDNKTFTADTTTALQSGMPNAAYNSLPANFNSFSEPKPEYVAALQFSVDCVG